MLRSIKELEKFRLVTLDGKPGGRIKDLYFDDQSWAVRHLVVALDPRLHGQKQILLASPSIDAFRDDDQTILLNARSTELAGAPSAASVLPVCKQYASLALSSPGASTFGRALTGADPHLRSARAVTHYRLNVQGEFAGTLSDILIEPADLEVRFLTVEQIVDRRKMQFHILPSAVERFTWASQRIVLKHLEPVAIEPNDGFTLDSSRHELVA